MIGVASIFNLTSFFVKISAARYRLEDEVEDMSEEEQEWADKVRKHRQRLHHSWVDADHPGCQLSGHLLLDRVPGNFHIQARSPHHDLVPHLTNVSHVIHSLSIGEPVAKRLIEHGVQNGGMKVPDTFLDKISPMDGNVYVNQDLHEAYHHYLKVVTTNVDGLKMGRRDMKAYQIIQSSQLSYYRSDVVPEAKVRLK
jgi:Endoplasmic reticulum vesicle transporter